MRTWNKLLDCLGGRYLRLDPWIPETYYYAARVISHVCFFFFYCMFDIVYDAEWLWQVILLHPPQKKRAWHFKYTFAWVHLYLTVWCLAFFKHTQTLWRRPPLPSLPPPPTPLFFLFFRISALTSYSHRLLLPLVCNQRKSTVVTVISNPWISVCSTKPPYWTPGDKDEAILLGLTSVSS